MNRWKILFIAAAGFSVLLAFQNCAKPLFDANDEDTKSVVSEDRASQSGHGNYPGANDPRFSAYAYVRPAGPGVCMNASEVQELIRFSVNTGNPFLFMSNCEPITPLEIAPSELSYEDANQNRAKYIGNTFYRLRR